MQAGGRAGARAGTTRLHPPLAPMRLPGQIAKLNSVADRTNSTLTTYVRSSPNNIFVPGYMPKFDFDAAGLAAAASQAANNAAAGTWALNFTITAADLAPSVQNRCGREQSSAVAFAACFPLPPVDALADLRWLPPGPPPHTHAAGQTSRPTAHRCTSRARLPTATPQTAATRPSGRSPTFWTTCLTTPQSPRSRPGWI